MQRSILSAAARKALPGSTITRKVAAMLSARAVGAVSSSTSTTTTSSITTGNNIYSVRFLSSSASPNNATKPQRPFYHIEVSNVARQGVTQIVVSGPGTLGLLASMCVTLATRGGSIKELYAADSLKERGFTYSGPYIAKPIRDIITCVDYQTGKAFRDDQLQDIANAILDSTRAPMKVVNAVKQEMTKILDASNEDTHEYDRGEITVIPSDRFKGL